MLLKVGLAMMLIGFLMLLCLFAAAALPTPPPADEGTGVPEALSKYLGGVGVNVPLLLFLLAFTAAIAAIAHFL